MMMFKTVVFLISLKKAVLNRGLSVLPEMSTETEEEHCIYDGGMVTFEACMEELGLVPASGSKWYVSSSRVSLVSVLEHMELMFLLAEKLDIL